MQNSSTTYGPPPLLSLLFSILCQAAGFSAGMLSPVLFGAPYIPLIAHCLVSAGLARLLRMSHPWILLNVLLPIGAGIISYQRIPTWLLGVLALLALLVYLPTFWTRVPFYPSRQSALQALEELLPKDREFSFVDLGSGFGKVLLALAPAYPNGSFVGVELSPLPFLVSWFRGLRYRNVSFEMKSFWNHDLSDYDYTYAFLSPTPMARLWQKVSEELSTGQTFITNSFMVSASPDKVIVLDDDRQNALHVFEI